jgi:hypothetical protein
MNAHRRFLRNVAFPIFLNKPDDNAGGGGSDEPKTLAESNAALKKAREDLATANTAKATAETGRANAEKERDQAVADGKAQKELADTAIAEAKTAKGELATAKEQITTITGERDEAKKQLTTAQGRITTLAGLCEVKGIDPNMAVEQKPQPGASEEDTLRADLAAATDPEKRGQLAEQLRQLTTKKKK